MDYEEVLNYGIGMVNNLFEEEQNVMEPILYGRGETIFEGCNNFERLVVVKYVGHYI